MMTRRRFIPLCSFAVLVLLFAGTVITAAPLAPVQVAFINVRQGDSILIRSGDFAVLVDGGRSYAGPTVVAYLRQQDVSDVDVMLVTHADSDRVGGLKDVLESEIPVHQVLYNGYPGTSATWSSFATAVVNADLTLSPAQFGQTFTWGETTAYVLNPLPGLTNPEQNNASVVVRIDHAAVHYLLPGDIDSTVEADIVARGTPVAAQILKVAHHGSNGNSGETFLAAVQPHEAVISVGPNSYGHPAPEALARLQAVGATIWRTDQDCTIVVVDDGSDYEVQPGCQTHVVLLPLVVR